MDMQMVKYLADLSKLEFSDEKLEETAAQMTDIIGLMDTVKEIDVTYDAYKDNHDVFLPELRTDSVVPSMETDRITSNAVSSNNCFVVPKVVE
ncbi:MAG: Asp-tRNA(Asn)/Glu-tRNA(Gln) amidotransferase subunit GatC [Ruminococcus sp.]|nr:Asp-tRNA(Asn)/Glu-tRNA(Gln) amidotransferase subunit GatC [Ruminococcus sp.]MBR2304985.1 Asp-tRNA(Asn)/Glu-tRNA(Gln) amidotransferase subunit GatC [Ruminococcus sp.]